MKNASVTIYVFVMNVALFVQTEISAFLGETNCQRWVKI